MISICRSAATLSAALPSWCRPITALTTVRPRTTRPGGHVLEGDDADHRRADQHELHQVAVLAQERLPARLLGFLGELVRAVCVAAARDLGRAQTDGRIDVEPAAGLLGRQAVPVRRRVGWADVVTVAPIRLPPLSSFVPRPLVDDAPFELDDV